MFKLNKSEKRDEHTKIAKIHRNFFQLLESIL